MRFGFSGTVSGCLKGGQQVVQMLRLCRVAEHPLEGLAVRMHTGRQPERGAAEVGGHIGRAVLEAAARELAGGQRHTAEVAVRRGPRESREGSVRNAATIAAIA